MYLMGLEMTIRLFDSYSLKDKRQVVKSIIQKVQNKYHISAAEVDDFECLNQAVLGFGLVTNSRHHGEVVLNDVVSFVEATYPVDISNLDWID